jgi:hypothetical protein
MTDNQQHPITPPPELVQQWIGDYYGCPVSGELAGVETAIATRAAQWGADQQLAEDAKWLDHNALNEPHLRITPVGESLKEAMRPKPPSLKEQALWELVDAYNLGQIDDSTYDTIRKALKALPND